MFDGKNSKKFIATAIIVIFIWSCIQVSTTNHLVAASDTNPPDPNQEISVAHNDDGSYTITYQPIGINEADAQKVLCKWYYYYYRDGVLRGGSYFELGSYTESRALGAGFYMADNSGSPIDSYVSLLRFNLAGFPYFATNVELRMYGFGGVLPFSEVHGLPPYPYGGSSTVSVHPITEPWSGKVGNEPKNGYDELVSSSLSRQEDVASFSNGKCDLTSRWYSWDITDLYNKWKDGTAKNYGVLVGLSDSIDISKYCNCHSFQGVYDWANNISPNRPKLVITYTPTICIDPGHMPIEIPSPDKPGEWINSPDQKKEYDIANGVAQILHSKLKGDKLNIKFTYPLDNVDQRADFVNNLRPDLFVSLHCNANKGITLGKEIYYCSYNTNMHGDEQYTFYREKPSQTFSEMILGSMVVTGLQESLQPNERYVSNIIPPIPKEFDYNPLFIKTNYLIPILLHIKVCPAVLLEMEFKDYTSSVKYGNIGFENMYDLLEHSIAWQTDAAQGIYNGISNYLNYYFFEGGIQQAHQDGMKIGVRCPVDLEVTDPAGQIFSKAANEIPDAIYDEGSNGDTIYLPTADSYKIRVIPEEGALPTDTFTLEVTKDGVTTVLAENVPIAEIPSTPYTFSPNVENQVSFNQLGAGVNPTVTYSIDNGPALSGTVPFSVPVTTGQSISYSYQQIVPGTTGVQYVLTSTSLSSPQIVDSDLEITSNYKTQYQVTVTTSDPSKGTITPTASAFYDSGSSVQISASPNIQYGFWKWSSTSSSVTFANESAASTTALINGPATVTATFALLVSGNKHLTLTGSNNVIMITGGNNQIDATQATSTTVIKIGAGNNKINLGGGNNFVQSTSDGNDQINTGNGDNKIYVSGNGNLQISTGNGNDVITLAGKGNNQIDAGNGNNQVTVGDGNNKVTAGSGNDIVFAGNGNNNIQTGAGNDQITVGNGNNSIDGGAGYDICVHGTGHNTILNCEKT